MTESAARHTGLSPAILADLKMVFRRYPEVQAVWIYGSRARGDYRPGSDIDLAIVAPHISAERFAALFGELEALPIAFPMDVLRWEEVTDPGLKENIRNERLPIYERDLPGEKTLMGR